MVITLHSNAQIPDKLLLEAKTTLPEGPHGRSMHRGKTQEKGQYIIHRGFNLTSDAGDQEDLFYV